MMVFLTYQRGTGHFTMNLARESHKDRHQTWHKTFSQNNCRGSTTELQPVSVCRTPPLTSYHTHTTIASVSADIFYTVFLPQMEGGQSDGRHHSGRVIVIVFCLKGQSHKCEVIVFCIKGQSHEIFFLQCFMNKQNIKIQSYPRLKYIVL